jgi:hypothetical protein
VRITGNRVHDRAGTGSCSAPPSNLDREERHPTLAPGSRSADGQADRAAVDNNQVLDIATTQGPRTARSASASCA